MIDFSYEKKEINAHSGCMFKGKHYRCFYIKYPTLYKNPFKGTETVELYDFRPKDKIKATAIILHGLGTRNIEFLLWMGTHLASAGVNAVVPVLPGNFTRIENGHMYGSRYLWPDYSVIYDVYQHAVVDILSAIDFIQQQDRWKDNNCMMGYCLGGMLGTIVSSLDNRINQKILMTTGGNIPRLMFESVAQGFIKKLIHDKKIKEPILRDKYALFNLYEKQLPNVKKMSLDELMTSKNINPVKQF